MPSHRSRRVSDLLRTIVSELLTNETQDPRLTHVRITEVTISKDLRHATFFFSLFPGGETERQAALLAFERANGWLRREIGSRAGLRIVPHLRFLSDVALERAAHIDEVLREVIPPEPPMDPEPGDGD